MKKETQLTAENALEEISAATGIGLDELKQKIQFVEETTDTKVASVIYDDGIRPSRKAAEQPKTDNKPFYDKFIGKAVYKSKIRK